MKSPQKNIRPIRREECSLQTPCFFLSREEWLTDTFAFQDNYKRSLAEAENVRKRMTNQINDAKLFGIQGFCKDLLEVKTIFVSSFRSRVNSDSMAVFDLRVLLTEVAEFPLPPTQG